MTQKINMTQDRVTKGSCDQDLIFNDSYKLDRSPSIPPFSGAETRPVSLPGRQPLRLCFEYLHAQRGGVSQRCTITRAIRLILRSPVLDYQEWG